jgi:putative ATPase
MGKFGLNQKMKKPRSKTESDLFDAKGLSNPAHAPLAVRMRPKTLEEILGQDHLLSKGKLLRRTLESGRLTSLILYGPPGSGKTTLAGVISQMTQSFFVAINAVTSNVAELRKILQEAKRRLAENQHKTILFIDEIHRFNRAQQDVLMPDVEEGNVILIGATVYNPSFVLNSPLLSRALVCELKPLSEENLIQLLKRALQDPVQGLGKLKVRADAGALAHLAKSSVGDARRALNALEVGVLTTPPNPEGEIVFDRQVAEESCQRKMVYHDRQGDYHYDLASAFIKSMRGSDPDAAVCWLAKMLYGGEDPRFIIRRIMIFASEDIGNADPQALILAAAGLQAVEFLGMPEIQIVLSHLVTYMALAPKSNASYLAIAKAMEDLKEQKVEEVPSRLRDRSYPGAKKLGHGEGYLYPHNYPTHYVSQEYRASTRSYYQPTAIGFEKILLERLNALKKQKNQEGLSPTEHA